MEAKLGFDRLTPDVFAKRFLQTPERSGHTNPRFAGSMTGILNHWARSDESGALETKDPTTKLVKPWFLVLRAKTWRSWATPPQLTNAHIAIFDSIVRAYGTSDAFDELVRDEVGRNFHTAWEIE